MRGRFRILGNDVLSAVLVLFGGVWGDAMDDFTYQAPQDRAALLLDAAERIRRLAGHLGDEDAAADPYSGLLRELSSDTAEFAAYPDVRPLPQVSPSTEAVTNFRLQDRFTFWWLRIPLLLFPRRNWAFSRLEVRIEFSPDEPQPDLRPKAFDILPDRRFDTVLKAGAHALLSVGADGHFTVRTPDVSVPVTGGAVVAAGAGAQAKASVESHVEFNPVEFRAVAARVDHTAPGLEKVFWRLDGSEFFQENQPEFVVVLQVPQEVESASVVGVLQAYRRFNLFPAGLQAAIRQLPEAIRVFFQQGAPLAARKTYEIALPRQW
jgi:hypothetical protein